MNAGRQEIEEVLEHQHKMVRLLRQRLQQRELQEAQYGVNVPPEVVNEIAALSERIHNHETEIARLQTLAAEDQLSLTEVEYRVAVAEAWNTSEGIPLVVGMARLERDRLRLGIAPKRASEIEHEVRVALAEETFSQLDIALLYSLYTTGSAENREYAQQDARAHLLKLIGRMIRLDLTTAVELLGLLLYREDLLAKEFFNELGKENGAWAYLRPKNLGSHSVFNDFQHELYEIMAAKKPPKRSIAGKDRRKFDQRA